MRSALLPANCHETAVKVGGYILGEFGFLLNTEEGAQDTLRSFAVLFALLHICMLFVMKPLQLNSAREHSAVELT